VSFDDIPDLQTFDPQYFGTNLFHSLSAVDLWTMNTYWFDVTSLHLSGVDQVTIDFSSLVEIAELFPFLEDFEIQVNCKTFPSVDDVPVLQHNLETLELIPLHFGNHIALARCIDRIFPKLVVLSISGSPPF
jgi:hypothetical protein